MDESPRWLLLFHDCIVEQLQKLHTAAERAERSNPEGFESNANVKLFRALSRLIMDTVPGDPARDEYRQGNTMGRAYRHWRRAKIGRRFRLFFRYDSNAKTIVFAWVNDQQSLRAAAGLCTIRPQDTTPGPIIPPGAPSDMKSTAELEQELPHLPPADRARLALKAWESLVNDPEAAADRALDAEGLSIALERDSELDSDSVEAIDDSEFRRRCGVMDED